MLGSIAMAIIYGLKVNLSVAMVAMLNHSALAHNAASAVGANEQHHQVNAEPVCQGSNSTEAVEVSLTKKLGPPIFCRTE